MKFSITILMGLFGFLVYADPAPPAGYEIDVSVFQADFSCTFATDGSGSQSCSINEGTQGDVPVQMAPIDCTDPNSDYTGTIATGDINGNYSLTLVADSMQNLEGVTLERDSQSADGSTEETDVTTAATPTLQAANFSPLTYSQDDSNVYVAGTIFGYEPANNVTLANGGVALNKYLRTHLRPLAMKHLKGSKKKK